MQIFRPGSTSPGTRLWDARELFEANSARCDKALRQLGPSALKEAVTTCIQAAGAVCVCVWVWVYVCVCLLVCLL